MDNNHSDLFGEAERNRRTMERGSFHRSPSTGVEAMVAVRRRRRSSTAAAGLRIVLLIFHTIPAVPRVS